MATSQVLISAMSEALGLSRASVETVYRELRESGLVSKAGRGPHASAKMTARDAANLLTAVLGSVRKGDAVGTIKMFSATRLLVDASSAGDDSTSRRWTPVDVPLPEFRELERPHSVVDLLEDFFAAASSGSLHDAMQMKLNPPRVGHIVVVVHKPTPGVSVRLTIGDYVADLRYGIPWTEGEKDTRTLVRHMERLTKELGITTTGDRKSYEEISQITFLEVGKRLRD